jgi:hypothetical protein
VTARASHKNGPSREGANRSSQNKRLAPYAPRADGFSTAAAPPSGVMNSGSHDSISYRQGSVSGTFDSTQATACCIYGAHAVASACLS